MDELDVDTYYGAYTRSVNTRQSAGELRVFGLGYMDDRTTVLKTDNRPAPVRAADLGKIEIATCGADYVACFQHHQRRQVRFPGLGRCPDRLLGQPHAACRRLRRRGRMATAGKSSEALAERRLFLRKRRRQSQ